MMWGRHRGRRATQRSPTPSPTNGWSFLCSCHIVRESIRRPVWCPSLRVLRKKNLVSFDKKEKTTMAGVQNGNCSSFADRWSLVGATALVTGGTKGIGYSLLPISAFVFSVSNPRWASMTFFFFSQVLHSRGIGWIWGSRAHLLQERSGAEQVLAGMEEEEF